MRSYQLDLLRQVIRHLPLLNNEQAQSQSDRVRAIIEKIPSPELREELEIELATANLVGSLYTDQQRQNEC